MRALAALALSCLARVATGAAGSEKPYSFSLSTFSPDGRLQQIEFAFKAVDRALPCAAMVLDGGVVVAKCCRAGDEGLGVSESPHVCRVTESVVATYAGLPADFRALVAKCQELAIAHARTWGEPMSVKALAAALGAHVQEHTQLGGLRPYGAAVLLAGVDAVDGAAALYRVDPSGWCAPRRGACVGSDAPDLRDKIAAKLDEGPSVDEAAAFLVDALDGGDRAVAVALARPPEDASWEIRTNAAAPEAEPPAN